MALNSVDIQVTLNSKIKKITNDIKNKINTASQLSILKSTIKKDNEIMDKAYLTLGKQCYKNMTQEEKSKYKAIVEIIEKKQKRLERAHYRYKEIAGILRPEDLEIKENVTEQDIQDITVACIKKETVPQQKVDSPEIAQEDSF